MKNSRIKKQIINQLLKPLFFLVFLIIVCGFLARNFAGSETIVDYVNKNQAAAAENGVPETEAATAENGISETEAAPVKNQEPETGSSKNPNVGTNPVKGQEPETGSVKNPDAGTGSSKNQAPETETAYKEEGTHIDNSKETSNGDNTMAQNIPAGRTVFAEGFYYEPLSEEIKSRITGISYPVAASEALSSVIPVTNILEEGTLPAVTYDDLRYLSVLYYDFNGEVQTGELICNRGIADDLMEIFHELYLNEYQIEKIRLVDEYQADDTASITDNNTSCFNYRVVDGTTSLSKHALGCAIDINPFYNPYVVFNKDGSGETYISPPGSEIYVDRSKDFPYKIDESDLCYKLFTEHGFTWGGNWNSSKDYQHFQIVL